MGKLPIDLKQLFLDSICSFEMAQKAKFAGMTCANTFFAYDESGQIGDGAWLENPPEMIKDLPAFKQPVLFPAINLALAIFMLDDILGADKIECYQIDDVYVCKFNGKGYEGKKLVDAVIDLWIHNKKK